MADEVMLWCWRHPKAQGAAGRCIGRTDLALDPRKAKRLAQRIRHTARAQGLPRVLWVSTLRRSADVGGWLRRWGWQVHVDARLCEMDFGAWDGRPWADIAWPEVQAWQDKLLHHAPGGGESLWQVQHRVQDFVAETLAAGMPRLLVTHGGWFNTWLHLPADCTDIEANHWPAAPRHGSLRVGPARR